MAQSISIIIPTLNEKTNLRRLIPLLCNKSAVRQVIVVDSISSTDAIENHFSHDKLTIIKSSQRCRSIQMNEGMALTEGTILFFLHADMTPPSQFDMDILTSIDEGNDAGCFGYHFDRNRKALNWLSYFSFKKTRFTGGGDQGLFILKNVFQELGGFDAKLKIMEDFEFYRRLKKNGKKFKIIQNPAVVSARKYDKNGFLRVNLIQLLVFSAFEFGLPQSWQIWIYKKGLNH